MGIEDETTKSIHKKVTGRVMSNVIQNPRYRITAKDNSKWNWDENEKVT